MINNKKYEKFKEDIVTSLRKEFEKRGIKAEVSVSSVERTNGSKDAVMIKLEGASVATLLYPKDCYMKGEFPNISVIADTLINSATEMDKKIDGLREFLESDEAKGHITPMAVNADRNRGILRDAPHRISNDLAVVYNLELPQGITPDGGKDTTSSIRITNSLAKGLGMDEEQLYKTAMENIKDELVCIKMEDMLYAVFGARGKGEILYDGITNLLKDELAEMQMRENSLFVLTRESGAKGAAAMLNKEVLESISEKLGSDLYILPSSIHEVIVVPKDAIEMSPKELSSMVKEINAESVLPEEQLSDSVYSYEKGNRDISVAWDAGKMPPVKDGRESR